MPTPLDLRTENQASRRKTRGRSEGFAGTLKWLRYFFLVSPLFFLNSCGGVVSGPATQGPVSITVMPGSAQPFIGGNVQFSAMVQNTASSAVTWQVNTIPGGNSALGTIDISGFYSAPPAVPNPATVTVTAVLQSDSSKTGSSSVTILGLSSIQGPLILSPALSSVTTMQTLQLQVLTAGVSNSLVNWSVDGIANGSAANGIIAASGLYTPPASAGAHLITAVLKANSNAIGSAQVEVTDFAGMLTWRNDNLRSGVNNKELALSPATVNSAKFGKLFSCAVDGFAYAQPLYMPNVLIPGSGTHNVVFVATENDSVFAFDADSNPCVQLWQTSLIPPGSQAVPMPNTDLAISDIVPYVGITGTPVISASASLLYVSAETSTIASNPTYTHTLYALDLATGQRRIAQNGVTVFPLAIPTTPFLSLLQNQRPALLLDNNFVYVAFGSHHGQGNYNGWLIAFDASTLQQVSAFVIAPGNRQAGIWQSGGGPSADANHNIFVLTADGPFGPNVAGTNYGDSLLRLGGAGTLSVGDSFTPCDQASLASMGLDFGASAAVLLPDSAGSPSTPHLAIGGAKNGALYVMNRDNLGGYNNVCPDSSQRVQKVPVGDGQILSTPLYWNNAVYLAAGNGALKSFPLSAGILASAPSSLQSPEIFGPQGATPVLSSNGANNAIVWLIDSSGAQIMPNSPAVLRAFDANNLANEIYNSGMVASRDMAGLAVKFSVPTVANAKVYVGTQGELDVFGLLH